MKTEELKQINEELEKIIRKKISGFHEIIFSFFSWSAGGFYLWLVFCTGFVESIPKDFVFPKGFEVFSIIGLVVCIAFPLYFFWIYSIEKWGIFKEEDV
jgi:hypothetical protein